MHVFASHLQDREKKINKQKDTSRKRGDPDINANSGPHFAVRIGNANFSIFGDQS
jgi:hypothetical protein